MSENENTLAARVKVAVDAAGGPTKVSKILNKGRATIYTWMPPSASSAPTIEEAAILAEAAGVRPAWLLLGEPPVRDGDAQPENSAAADFPDTVEIPILTMAASAGLGSIPMDGAEEQGTVTFPRNWARTYGTPARLRLVEIVGDSMAPDLNDRDWMLIDLDQVELRDGVALVRLDEALMVKRLQPQGRTVLLTSSNPAYHPIPVDLKLDGERFKIIGRGRWAGKTLP